MLDGAPTRSFAHFFVYTGTLCRSCTACGVSKHKYCASELLDYVGTAATINRVRFSFPLFLPMSRVRFRNPLLASLELNPDPYSSCFLSIENSQVGSCHQRKHWVGLSRRRSSRLPEACAYTLLFIVSCLIENSQGGSSHTLNRRHDDGRQVDLKIHG